MGKNTTSLWTLGEPLFLGLSCLVGGEQFYILLYGTGRSARAQSFVLVFTAIITCIISAAVSSRTDILAHFFHLFYIYIIILQMTIANEITGGIIATIVTIGLGYALTMLVIQSCSLYSTSREELLTFILGMFSARYLPCFLRLFVSKKCTCDSKIKKLSKALGISRLVFCIISLFLKVLMGRFHLTYGRPSIEAKIGENNKNSQSNNDLFSKILEMIKKDWENVSKEAKNFYEISFKSGFQQIWHHKKYFVENNVSEKVIGQFYKEYLTRIFKFLPIVMFLGYLFIFLMYPKTSFSAYCSYSPKVISTMMNVKFVLHIIGSVFGIRYPLSVTSNSIMFLTMQFLFFCIYIFVNIMNSVYGKTITNKLLVLMATESLFLGYLWAYNLGLIINMVMTETCIYEEFETIDRTNTFYLSKFKNKKSCCGEKITSKCYCKLENIVKIIDPTVEYNKMFECSSLTTGQSSYIRLKYSKDGQCAILLMYNTGDSDCPKTCDVSCCDTQCKNNCCLKIIGKYKVDAVTVSSCEDCQLTIRLDGSCCDPGKCPKCCDNGSGTPCVCSTSSNNCCCICVKCCNASCQVPGKCCCIHYCKNCTSCSCQCKCNSQNNREYVRLFICYKVENKSYIKEIRPNDKADFVGDLKVKTQFDIQEILISDCCHVDVRIDLRCAVKNNYFRLGGANYPRKFERPDTVSLFWSEGVCCPPTTKPQCCCMFSQLVRGYVMFIDEGVESMNIEICKITCGCNDGKQCCVMPCYIQIDTSGGFVKRVDRIRVKLVVISWLFFGLLFFFVVLFASMFRSKYSPVTFYPITSYSKLAGTFAINKYNSNEQVTARIVSLLVNSKISDQTIEAKKVEMKAMLRIFVKYTKSQETKKTKKRKPKEVEKIHKYITTKSTSFSPSSNIGGRACELCVIEWSHCVGLVYKYAMPLFLFIQKFFIAWEEAWKIEFYNYKKQIMPYFRKTTHNSNISLSTVMRGAKVGDKSNQMDLNRLMTWNGTSKQTNQLSQEKMEEDNMRTESIPPKIGNRLCYYVRRWNHRLDNIRNWLEYESHLFDWAKFLNEYYKIREWVTDVSPGLSCDSEVKVSIKDLNKGIEIFIATI